MINKFKIFGIVDDIHISLAPEEVFRVGDFVVTNSMIYGGIVAIFVLVFFSFVARRMTIKPQRGPVAIVEMIFEYLIGMMTDVFGSRKQAIRFLPIFSVYFIYIMFGNMSGLLPWVGEGVTGGPDGIPALRPFTADLNGVVAMAVFSIVAVQVLSVREQGIKNHMKHYFTDKPFNPINIFVGLLEMIGELTRVLSLSLRLFLNTVIGEILVTVFVSISGAGTPLALVPIIMFELLVAYVQAYVFTILSATYLSMAIAHAVVDDHHEDAPETDHSPSVAQAQEA